MIVTDNDNNNREHYLEKLTQGDQEDVTRIFLDDTGKHRQSGHKDHAKNHILKTMEDTEGKIFKESRFVKFAHGKKSHHVRNSPRINVTKKVKHHAKKVKENKMAHLKKHYLKTKTKSKTRINKEKQSWTRKDINRNPNVVKVQQARKISKKYVAAKKLTSKSALSQSHGKPKGPFKKHGNGGQRNNALKDSKQEVNATLTKAQNLMTTFSKSSISALGNLSTSANATRALGLISQLISEIQKNPLVTKIALEALKNPVIGKLFGIDSSKDTAENIQERLLPIATIKQKTQDLENGSESNGSGAHIDTRIVDRDRVSNLSEKSNHLEMITPGTIESIKQKHFQFFKILKDNKEDYKNDESDVNGSGIEGSGMSGSGYYFDGSGSGKEEGLKAANHQLINCAGSKNCAENSLLDLSVSSEPHKTLEKEENSYEMFDEDNTESQYGEGDGDEVFEDASRPVGSVEDSEDLIPEFGFDLRAISEPDLDLCNFSAVLSNGSSIITQKAPCVENGTIEKHNDERDKEDKTLAHYLAVDKLKSASGDYGLDSGDDQDGSSSKIDDDDDNQNIGQDDSDEKYNGKDLVVLQEALEDQLSRLSKDPASEKSNKEILARVRDDIKRGDIDDLELLEAQISGGKTDLSRVIRSNTPEDDEIDGLEDATEDTPEIFEGYNGEGEELQRRRISHKVLNKEKPSQTYYVNPDKYGKVNSGILKSWTLILYGTK